MNKKIVGIIASIATVIILIAVSHNRLAHRKARAAEEASRTETVMDVVPDAAKQDSIIRQDSVMSRDSVIVQDSVMMRDSIAPDDSILCEVPDWRIE